MKYAPVGTIKVAAMNAPQVFQGISAEVVDEVGVRGDLVTIDAELIGNDVDNSICDRCHVCSPTAIYGECMTVNRGDSPVDC